MENDLGVANRPDAEVGACWELRWHGVEWWRGGCKCRVESRRRDVLIVFRQAITYQDNLGSKPITYRTTHRVIGFESRTWTSPGGGRIRADVKLGKAARVES